MEITQAEPPPTPAASSAANAALPKTPTAAENGDVRITSPSKTVRGVHDVLLSTRRFSVDKRSPSHHFLVERPSDQPVVMHLGTPKNAGTNNSAAFLPAARAKLRAPPLPTSPPTTYPLEQLVGGVQWPRGVDATRREMWLNDRDFHAVFHMDRLSFLQLPPFKQMLLKTKARLF